MGPGAEAEALGLGLNPWAEAEGAGLVRPVHPVRLVRLMAWLGAALLAVPNRLFA